MMIRDHPCFCFLYILIYLFCIVFLIVSSAEAQFSRFTLFPLNAALGYRDLYNPLVFSPGIDLRFAALSIPLDLFPSFGLGIGDPFSALWQLRYNPLNISFGLGNPFNAFSFLGYNSFLPFSPFSPLGLNPIHTITTSSFSPARIAAQTGSWSGTWESTYIAFIVLWNTGPMLLNIVEDPLKGGLIGTAILQGSRYANTLFDVSGVLVNNVITLEGLLPAGSIILTCILTSPTIMTGFFTVVGHAGLLVDEGIFNLILNPPVIL